MIELSCYLINGNWHMYRTTRRCNLTWGWPEWGKLASYEQFCWKTGLYGYNVLQEKHICIEFKNFLRSTIRNFPYRQSENVNRPKTGTTTGSTNKKFRISLFNSQRTFIRFSYFKILPTHQPSTTQTTLDTPTLKFHPGLMDFAFIAAAGDSKVIKNVINHKVEPFSSHLS